MEYSIMKNITLADQYRISGGIEQNYDEDFYAQLLTTNVNALDKFATSYEARTKLMVIETAKQQGVEIDTFMQQFQQYSL
jgi:hypothetical protein